MPRKPTGKPNGRPPKLAPGTEAEVREKIEKYFESCTGKVVATMAGLALELGMTRETLLEYGKKEGEFSAAIKEARQKVESAWESNLARSGSTGSIFWLKNNAGWRARTEVEHSGAITLEQIVGASMGDDE